MMTEAAFRAKADAFGVPRLLKRSVLAFSTGGAILERTLRGQGYRTVLEIGTYRGVSTAYIAQMCERVITVDLYTGQLEREGEVFDRRAFWSHMGVEEKITQVRVSGDAEKAQLLSGRQFDFAFIDGGLVNVASDFALVKRCGAVLFHDYDTTKDRRIVFDLVNSLPPSEVEIMDNFALWKAA